MAGIYKDAPMHSTGGGLAIGDAGTGVMVEIYDNCYEIILTYVTGAAGNVIAVELTSLRYGPVRKGKASDGGAETGIYASSIFWGKNVRLKIGPRSQRPGYDKVYIYRADNSDTGTFLWNVTQLLGVAT